MAESREYSAEAFQSAQQVRVLVSVCVDINVDMVGSWKMIGKDRMMADLPWASKESKNLVAASASRNVLLRLGPWQASFDSRQGSPSSCQCSLPACPEQRHCCDSVWSAEMSYKRSGVMFSRRNKAKEKCSAPTDSSMSSSDSGFTCRPIIGI